MKYKILITLNIIHTLILSMPVESAPIIEPTQEELEYAKLDTELQEIVQETCRNIIPFKDNSTHLFNNVIHQYGTLASKDKDKLIFSPFNPKISKIVVLLPPKFVYSIDLSLDSHVPLSLVQWRNRLGSYHDRTTSNLNFRSYYFASPIFSDQDNTVCHVELFSPTNRRSSLLADMIDYDVVKVDVGGIRISKGSKIYPLVP